MNTQLTEIMRLLTNLIRVGTITEVDQVQWRCRVRTGDLTTNWINWLTLRAGPTCSWWCPALGEQVLLLSIGGNLDNAFALPAIYSDTFPPPSTAANSTVIRYADGGQLVYDSEQQLLKISGVKNLLIEGNDSLQIKTHHLVMVADQVELSGNLDIKGSVTQHSGSLQSNGIQLDNHKHSAVKAGGDMSGGPI